MIKKLLCVRTDRVDPYANLALEEHLLNCVDQDTCILYLWQNRNTVVIGCNQNAWKECRTTLLESEDGLLARRLSGGGAVFHDLGNLNFTFLTAEENYDLDRQLSVIETACRSLGVQVERSGRNDVLAQGQKFSGNAFFHRQGKAYHHGTLLVDVDMDKLSRYLSPSKAKLQAKGVESVRARVINLNTLCPGLTCSEMADRMEAAFGVVYGLPVTTANELADAAAITDLRQRYASRQWLYGPRLPLSLECEARFSWGGIQLQLQVESGTVTGVKVYSDEMDWQFPPLVERALSGCEFSLSALCARLRDALPGDSRTEDLCTLLSQQDI